MRQLRFWTTAVTNFITVAASKTLTVAASLMLCLAMLGWALPAQADNRISPRLSEQVLQIIREHPEVIIESVQAYQQQQQQQLQQAQQAFLQQLQTNPQLAIGESPTTGAESSKIVLIEFSDFQCPYCAEAHKTIKQFMAKHQDEVLLVYKHFPLTAAHPEALPAAKAAWAARQQGKFWEYQDALFTQQDKLGEALYLATAQSLNLDLEQFNGDSASAPAGLRNAADAAIGQDMQLAERLGISGTPFFVMYGGSTKGYGEAFSGAVQLSDMENILARVSKS